MTPAEENDYPETECFEAELIPLEGQEDKPGRKLYTYASTEFGALQQFANGGIHAASIQAIRIAPPLAAELLADNAPQRETRK